MELRRYSDMIRNPFEEVVVGLLLQDQDLNPNTNVEIFGNGLILVTDPNQGVAQFTFYFDQKKYTPKAPVSGAVSTFPQGSIWHVSHGHILVLRQKSIHELFDCTCAISGHTEGSRSTKISELRPEPVGV